MPLHPSPSQLAPASFLKLERKIGMKNRRLFPFCFLLFSFFFIQPVWAHSPFDIELKVWSSQSFDDPFCSDDPIEVYFRVNRASYITVYQINPYGGVDVLYPLAYHRWRPVYPGRTYRLTELSSDLDFWYDGLEGNAYIGLIATQQPIDIVPWLEAGFRNQGLVFGRPQRVVVGVDFRLTIDRVLADVRLRLGSACAPSYYVAPIYVRPRVVVHRRPPVVVWPTPPRHKPYPPKWGHRDDDDYRPAPDKRNFDPPEKRPFRRRGYDTSEVNGNPDSPKSGGRSASESDRSRLDKRSSNKTEEIKVKDKSTGGKSEEPSHGSERRVKKPRN
jgi:hypothetical protein